MNKYKRFNILFNMKFNLININKIVGEGCVLYEFLDLKDDRENLRGSAIAGEGSFSILIY